MSTPIATPPPPTEPAIDGRSTRGQERRELLMQTTLRLIAERGIDAVSHRAVAEASGVPLGSTTYWFDSRKKMLTESLESFVRQEIDSLNERLSGVLEGDPSRERLVDEFTALLMWQLGEDRWRTVAQYTMLQETIRHPELVPVCRDWTEAWQAALERLFESLEVPDPTLEARMFLSMLDGILLGQLAVPEPDVEESLIRPTLEKWFSRPVAGETEAERNMS